MANKTVTELTAITSPDPTDSFPVADASDSAELRRITWQNLLNAITHEETFSSATSWTVSHNLKHRPGGVLAIDSSGDEIVGTIAHNSINQLTISFSAATSGTVYIS